MDYEYGQLHLQKHNCFPHSPRAWELVVNVNYIRGGGPLEYWWGAWIFCGNKYFCRTKIGEINKWPQDMVEINILPIQEAQINIIYVLK